MAGMQNAAGRTSRPAAQRTPVCRRSPGGEQRSRCPPTLQSDNVFGDDDGGASQLGTATGDVTTGYAVALVVGVDTGTPPA